MEKSIENIWKEGFMKKPPTPVFRIQDLKSMSSVYYIDQFKSRYKKNIVGLCFTAILVLLALIIGGVPYIGFYLFMLFASTAILGQIELTKLERLNLGHSNYEFLRSFNYWLKNLMLKFSMLYRILVPLIFLGFSVALLKTNLFEPFIGETLAERLIGEETKILAGLPLFCWIGIFVLAALLSHFSQLLFRLEMQSIYGELIARIDQLLEEMHTLT